MSPACNERGRTLLCFCVVLISLKEVVRGFGVTGPFASYVRNHATFGCSPCSRKTHAKVGMLRAFGHDRGSPRTPAVIPGAARPV